MSNEAQKIVRNYVSKYLCKYYSFSSEQLMLESSNSIQLVFFGEYQFLEKGEIDKKERMIDSEKG